MDSCLVCEEPVQGVGAVTFWRFPNGVRTLYFTHEGCAEVLAEWDRKREGEPPAGR